MAQPNLSFAYHVENFVLQYASVCGNTNVTEYLNYGAAREAETRMLGANHTIISCIIHAHKLNSANADSKIHQHLTKFTTISHMLMRHQKVTNIDIYLNN